MTLRAWLAGPLPADVETALARLERTPDVAHVAVMPDVHLAEDVCIGTVVATRTRLFPAAVGGDIGCGMAAVRLSEASPLDERRAAAILAGFGEHVPAVRHRERQVLPSALDAALSDSSLDRLREREGRVEFATLGRGNHFCELQEDEEGRLWLMLHSGSRAMGQAIREHHLRFAENAADSPDFIAADSDRGRAYLHDVAWALAYADASRRAMLDAAGRVLEQVLGAVPEWDSAILCHHNHVRSEEHFGERFWVHRKGAIPATDGEHGVIPGSMGAESFHVTGRGVAEALCSASHGAGRAMSRTEARRRISMRTFTREMQGIWYDHRLADRLRDEAPSAYKDVRAVLRAERELVRIERVLRPRLSYKAA